MEHFRWRKIISLLVYTCLSCQSSPLAWNEENVWRQEEKKNICVFLCVSGVEAATHLISSAYGDDLKQKPGCIQWKKTRTWEYYWQSNGGKSEHEKRISFFHPVAGKQEIYCVNFYIYSHRSYIVNKIHLHNRGKLMENIHVFKRPLPTKNLCSRKCFRVQAFFFFFKVELKGLKAG